VDWYKYKYTLNKYCSLILLFLPVKKTKKTRYKVFLKIISQAIYPCKTKINKRLV